MKILRLISGLLFPNVCVFCGNIIKDEIDGVCDTCAGKLHFVHKSSTVRGNYFTHCTAPLYYKDSVRESLQKFKFSGRVNYADVYARLMMDYITADFDVISWIPVSNKRLRSRGYDQAKLLADCIAKRFGTEPIRLLNKHKHNTAQSKLETAEQKRDNVIGAYTAINIELCKGKHVLLIDDIITTGSTMSEASKTLLKAGADRVTGVCVARVPD